MNVWHGFLSFTISYFFLLQVAFALSLTSSFLRSVCRFVPFLAFPIGSLLFAVVCFQFDSRCAKRLFPAGAGFHICVQRGSLGSFLIFLFRRGGIWWGRRASSYIFLNNLVPAVPSLIFLQDQWLFETVATPHEDCARFGKLRCFLGWSFRFKDQARFISSKNYKVFSAVRYQTRLMF